MVTAAPQELIRNDFFLIYAIVPGDFFKECFGRWLLELGLEIAFVMEKGRLLVFGTWKQNLAMSNLQGALAHIKVLVSFKADGGDEEIFGRIGFGEISPG